MFRLVRQRRPGVCFPTNHQLVEQCKPYHLISPCAFDSIRKKCPMPEVLAANVMLAPHQSVGHLNSPKR